MFKKFFDYYTRLGNKTQSNIFLTLIFLLVVLVICTLVFDSDLFGTIAFFYSLALIVVMYSYLRYIITTGRGKEEKLKEELLSETKQGEE